MKKNFSILLIAIFIIAMTIYMKDQRIAFNEDQKTAVKYPCNIMFMNHSLNTRKLKSDMLK
jgi:hypothetical protein